MKRTVFFLALFALIIILFGLLLLNREPEDIPVFANCTYLPERTAFAPENPVTPVLATPEPLAIRQKFLDLMAETGNGDIVGWIKIEGTSVDYPVVQWADNDYYLLRDLGGIPDAAGSIFMDYENDVTKPDRNTIIYGHNMKADIMFHSLRNYTDEEYFKKHRYIGFDTLYEDGVWEVFSFYRSDISFYFIQAVFVEGEFEELVRGMKARSMYDTGVEIGGGDRVLTLVTCTGDDRDVRYVLNARLVKQNPY